MSNLTFLDFMFATASPKQTLISKYVFTADNESVTKTFNIAYPLNLGRYRQPLAFTPE